MLQIPQAWQGLLEDICRAEYFQRLDALVTQAYEAGEVYPPRAQLFACLEAVPPEGVRAVILGADPYHGRGRPMAGLLRHPGGKAAAVFAEYF